MKRCDGGHARFDAIGATRAGVAAVAGYALGSLPVAVVVAGRRGVDPRMVGDGNPGYWNVKEQLGARSALPVFVGDAAKGLVAGALGRRLGSGGRWWIGPVAVAGAMIGHAWPALGTRPGGRSILAFAGGMVAVSPTSAAVAIGGCATVSAVTGSFAYGARAGVFAFPVVQLAFDPPVRVAATGVLMSIIGLRFLQARRTSVPASAGSAAASPR